MKNFKLSILFLFLCSLLTAQNIASDSTKKEKKINLHEVGFFYEPQATWFFFLPSPGVYESMPTFKSAFGFLYGHYGKENSGIETGILYSRQGQNFTESRVYNYNGQIDSTVLNVKFSLTYFKVPIMLKISGNPKKRFWANFNLGLQIGFLNTATLKIEDTEASPYNYNQRVDLKRYLRPIDINAVGCLGFNFKIKNEIALFTGLRYDHSIFNVSKTNPIPQAPPSNNTSFGILFGIKKILAPSSLGKKEGTEKNTDKWEY